MKNIIQYCRIIIFIISSFVNAENYDAKWMSLLDRKLKINEINIPGTHDSGTYNVAIVKSPIAQTQYLNIKEQLENGIKYLDIRLSLDDEKNVYLSHEDATCYESFWSWKKL